MSPLSVARRSFASIVQPNAAAPAPADPSADPNAAVAKVSNQFVSALPAGLTAAPAPAPELRSGSPLSIFRNRLFSILRPGAAPAAASPAAAPSAAPTMTLPTAPPAAPPAMSFPEPQPLQLPQPQALPAFQPAASSLGQLAAATPTPSYSMPVAAPRFSVQYDPAAGMALLQQMAAAYNSGAPR